MTSVDYNRLHDRISASERRKIISDYPLSDILSAPGHRTLRKPEAVREMVQSMQAGHLEKMFLEPILLGVFTIADGDTVRLRAIECLDGHHRLLAALKSGVWRVIGDLPHRALDTRVNGWRCDGLAPEARWIPMGVVDRSRLREVDWSPVPEAWGAKGPTAMISGTFCSLDPVFNETDRGVPLGRLARDI